jgi:hypothetical protein
VETAGRFVAQYWLSLAPVPAFVATVAGLVELAHRPSRRALTAMLETILLLTAALVVVVARAPGELYPFIGRFYVGAPLALECAAIALAIGRLTPRMAQGTAAALSAVVALVAVRGDLASRARGDPSLRLLTAAIQQDARSRGVTAVELAFQPDDLWPTAAGLLVDLGREGTRACVAAPDWGVLFTPERLCDGGSGGERYVVVKPEACEPTCLARTQRAGVALSTEERDAGASTASN